MVCRNKITGSERSPSIQGELQQFINGDLLSKQSHCPGKTFLARYCISDHMPYTIIATTPIYVCKTLILQSELKIHDTVNTLNLQNKDIHYFLDTIVTLVHHACMQNIPSYYITQIAKCM